MTEGELRVKIGEVILQHAPNATVIAHALAEVVAVFILSHCRQDGTPKQIQASKRAMLADHLNDVSFALRELVKAKAREAAAPMTRQ